MRTLISICLVAALGGFSSQACGQDWETFQLKSDAGPIEARMLSWDFQTSSLKVEFADGTTRDLAASELHSSDMRKVERLLTKQMAAGRKSTPNKSESANSSRSTDRYSSKNSESMAQPTLPQDGFRQSGSGFSQAGGYAVGNGQTSAWHVMRGYQFSWGRSGEGPKKTEPVYPGDPPKSRDSQSADAYDKNQNP